ECFEKQLLPRTKARPAFAVVEGGGNTVLAGEFTLGNQQPVKHGVAAPAYVAGGPALVRGGERFTTVHAGERGSCSLQFAEYRRRDHIISPPFNTSHCGYGPRRAPCSSHTTMPANSATRRAEGSYSREKRRPGCDGESLAECAGRLFPAPSSPSAAAPGHSSSRACARNPVAPW